MAGETDGGTAMAVMGGLVAHAEAAQAALDKGLLAQAGQAETIRQLIRHAAATLERLRAEAEQIGARAEKAGAAAIGGAVEQSLSGAGVVVERAARAALQPLLTGAEARIAAMRRATFALDGAAARFSGRMLAIAAASATGALAAAGLGMFLALGWQRAELASLANEKAALQEEMAAIAETARKMRAEGVKIEFGDCLEPGGRKRRCVAAQPGTKSWGTAEAPWFILKGY